MANYCEYEMMVVSKKKESIERLKSIMEYNDKEFYIYRVQDIVVDEGPVEKDGLWVAKFSGGVAWSCTPWVSDKPDPNTKNRLGASHTNLKELCKKLDVAVEIWAEEEDNQFQQYILIDNKGDVCAEDVKDWKLEYDEDDYVIDEDGGFDEYGDFQLPSEIYKEN